MKEQYNVLFLCTGNSARSIMAEVIANQLGRGRFRAYSAGSQPAARVHPVALDILQEVGLPTDSLRPKSWDQFGGPHAPEMDFIITLCDRAAGEQCPTWPGHQLAVETRLSQPGKSPPNAAG